MLTNSMTKLIRDRWRSDRPFAGHTSESLLRKIRCPALSEAAREEARQELELRVQMELPV